MIVLLSVHPIMYYEVAYIGLKKLILLLLSNVRLFQFSKQKMKKENETTTRVIKP
ncbi:hypothetical protein ACSIGC_12955 [Tenacibaculum sp. ZS6-P6]|uniref:hypothetical protein n=1 Tax=Tenacibaculum sp. ZS6-P6 TaxID=3447503 RepID=UPI003F98E653